MRRKTEGLCNPDDCPYRQRAKAQYDFDVELLRKRYAQLYNDLAAENNALHIMLDKYRNNSNDQSNDGNDGA